MANPAIANFLSNYHRHSRTHLQIETAAERGARLEALEALPPLERAIASLLYDLDNQVGAARPDSPVTFFASQVQSWSQQLYDALEREASSPAEEIESTPPGL